MRTRKSMRAGHTVRIELRVERPGRQHRVGGAVEHREVAVALAARLEDEPAVLFDRGCDGPVESLATASRIADAFAVQCAPLPSTSLMRNVTTPLGKHGDRSGGAVAAHADPSHV